MTNFINSCVISIIKKNSPLVVGLDPHFDLFPSIYKNNSTTQKEIASGILDFNRKIIDAVYDIVPAVKPQIAFYEKFGLDGLTAYSNTIKYAKDKGLLVIGDIKRNDIDSTARAYSDAHLSETIYNSIENHDFNVDAITINPYFGSDGIKPFVDNIKKFGKGVFVLVKTSNPSSKEFQDVIVESSQNDKIKFHELVAQYVNKWGKDSIGEYGYSSVGAVVGATFPEEIKILREIMPNTYFLLPGIGTQGGKINEIKPCFDKNKLGALISVSRSVLYAYKNNSKFNESLFAEAARDEVLKINKQIAVLFN